MTRHPGTEGNSLQPKRVDAQEDVTVPSDDGRISVADIESDISDQLDDLQLAFGPYEDVTADRSANVQYQNNTGHPLYVIAKFGDDDLNRIEIDGEVVFDFFNAGSLSSYGFWVPIDSKYEIDTGAGPDLLGWFEQTMEVTT